MLKRIFVGVPLSLELNQQILQWQSKHQDSNSKTRWIEPKNLHITLVPPWQADNLKIDKTIKILRQLISQPFKINFSNISIGPNAKQPRMIWLVGEPSKQIEDLRLKIYKALEKHPDDRIFKLHVTLARFKLKPMELPLPEKFDWQMSVERFVLYESKLSPQGAKYTILEEFPI